MITDAEAIGKFESASETELFDIEYWSLEQAKLGRTPQKPLVGQVAVVTGGGSGIGAMTAAAFGREGAEVAVLDIDEAAARDTARAVADSAMATSSNASLSLRLNFGEKSVLLDSSS